MNLERLESSDWGIVRWVKVIWSDDPETAPLDAEVLDVNCGWYDTKAKSLDSQSLVTRRKTLDALRTHLSSVLVETKKR